MNVRLEYDPYNPLPDLCSVADFRKPGVGHYLNVEGLSMPVPGYHENRFASVWRERAVVVIFNVSRQENFGTFIPYLAMNYFDRFISREKAIPKVLKYAQHDLELLSICCLTLACKMRNKNFSTAQFMGQNQELRAVMPGQFLNMELHIVKALHWNMRSVTAFCFVPYFAPYFDSTYGFRSRTINEIITQSQNDFSMTRFRPSVIAASALLAASTFLYPEQFGILKDRIISKIFVTEENVLECMEKLIDMCKDLGILIESAVPENEYLPIRKVRAVDTSRQAAETSKSVTADQATFEKKKQIATTSSKQVAAESSEQAADDESKQVATESSKQVASGKTARSTEEHKQLATEISEKVITESSEGVTVASNEQVDVQKSEDSTEEPKRVSTERLKEAASELTEQRKVLPARQVDAQKSEDSIKEQKQSATESLEEVVAESSEQQTAVLTEKGAAEKLGASTEKSAEQSKQVASESSDQPEAVSIEQAAAEKTKASTDDSKHAASERLKEVAAESPEQPTKVAAGKTEESTAQESTEAGSEISKEVATETSERSITVGALSRASTSSLRPSKGKEKLVEMTEMPKMAEDSEDIAFDFVLRWRLGEINAEGFVIFTDIAKLGKNIRRLPEPAAMNQVPQNTLPNICNSCCCHSNCCNRCSLL